MASASLDQDFATTQAAVAPNVLPAMPTSTASPAPPPAPTNANAQPEENVGDAGEDDDADGDEDEDGSEISSRESDYDSDGDSVDEIDKAHERKNRLYELDEDGQLHWKRNECSYTYAEFHRRGHNGQSLARTFMYDLASSQDLRKYVLRRGLPDPYPQGLTMKYLYLRILEQADKDMSFRFLDLPPELRNAIYTELLTFKRCTHCPRVHECCHNKILRANKQVYKEAKEILYADNEILCLFNASGFGAGPKDFLSIVHTREMEGTDNSMDMIHLGMSQIPDWFRRVQLLHVQLDFSGGDIDEAQFKLQTCLLNLATFLMDGHRLKKLTIKIRDVSGGSEDEKDDKDGNHDTDNIPAKLDAMLYPLCRLHGIEQIVITGVSDSAAKEAIAEMHKNPKQTFNTLQHLGHLRKSVDAYTKMMEAMIPYGYAQGETAFIDMDASFSSDIESLVMELGEFADMDEYYNPFADAAAEANTRRKMEDLRDCMTKMNLSKFEQHRKDFYTSLKATREYTSKSKWIPVDGRKKKVSETPRRDWDSRMENEW